MATITRSVDGLRRAEPRSAGVDSREIAGFLDDIEAAGLELHDLMLWRDGAVIAEGWRWPHRADRLRIVHSMTKSVTACAIGLLVDDGRLALDDTVADFFPEMGIDPATPAARITVEDLLTMRAGHASEVSGAVWRGIATSWIDEFFRIPITHEPGTVHVYSSAVSYMLSAIVTRVTGETMADFLTSRLFVPLGITDARWDVGPDGINPGGNGLSLTTADALKIGILHAQNGLWEGRRLLSETWVGAATRAHAADYGYHWVVGNGYFAAVGVFVQMVLVFPPAGAVLAINGAMPDSKAVLPHIERRFPAAFAKAGDAAADSALAARLAGWQTVPPLCSTVGGNVAAFAGRWMLDRNECGLSDLSLAFGTEGVEMVLRDKDGEHAIVATLDGWREAPAYLPGADLHHGYRTAGAATVAGARWLASDQVELVVHFVESAFRDRFWLHSDGDQLTMKRQVNINSGPLAWPTLTATRAKPIQ